jgi:hypothetical protein
MAGGDPSDPLISDSYQGWWRRSIAVIRETWPQLLVLQVIGAVISLLWGLALRRIRVPFMVEKDQVQVLDLVARVAAELAGALIDVLTFTLVTLAVVHLVVLTAAGDPPGIGRCLRGAARRLLPLLGWGLLSGVMIAVGLLFCLLPGFYVMLVLLVLAPVVAIERGGGIGRCFDLFNSGSGAAWSRNGTILAVTVGVTAAGSALALPLTAAFGSVQVDPGEGTSIASLIVGSIVGAAVGMLTGPLTVTAYADLRACRESITTADLAAQLTRP